MRKLILSLTLVCACAIVFSQKKKHTTEEPLTPEILSQALDCTTFLNNAGSQACNCIDSVNKAEKDQNKKLEAFSNCIHDQVEAYQLALKLLGSLKSNQKNNQINLVVNKESAEYKHYYYRIESWLKDSCKTLNTALATNDQTSENSYSTNKDALDAYNGGLQPLKEEKYQEAIPWFEKAVSIDPKFAFAWDNLGVCYRRINNFPKAEEAYKQSLSIDPKGKTALQNLPVVYLYEKKNDEAIQAYKNILQYYPDDPEAYYGVALVYFQNKDDMENALINACKAYNRYVELKSPYRSDAEKLINNIYSQMKKDGHEELFNKILKENHISSN